MKRLLLLLAAACTAEGPQGEPGPTGQRGPTGPPGADAPPLRTYIVEVTGEPPCEAWCEAGDVPIGGGCRWSGDVGVSAGEPAFDVEEFVGWSCDGVSAQGDEVTTSAVCAEGAGGG